MLHNRVIIINRLHSITKAHYKNLQCTLTWYFY